MPDGRTANHPERLNTNVTAESGSRRPSGSAATYHGVDHLRQFGGGTGPAVRHVFAVYLRNSNRNGPRTNTRADEPLLPRVDCCLTTQEWPLSNIWFTTAMILCGDTPRASASYADVHSPPSNSRLAIRSVNRFRVTIPSGPAVVRRASIGRACFERLLTLCDACLSSR
jgi:hypothetical protein